MEVKQLIQIYFLLRGDLDKLHSKKYEILWLHSRVKIGTVFEICIMLNSPFNYRIASIVDSCRILTFSITLNSL